MATLLFAVIFIAYVGLGIPDALFGTAWPAVYREFNLPVSYANFVTVIISGGTILSSLVSFKLVKKFGTGKITAASTLLTAAAILGFSCSDNILWLCLFAVPLGFGAGAVDSALNAYTALNYKASHISFLHCSYGIGVSLSPYLMSAALSGGNWRNGYRSVFYFQIVIAAVTIISLPLWKKSSEMKKEAETRLHNSAALSKSVKKSAVISSMCIFFCSCAIEYTCGIWGSTFLVNVKNIGADAAAGIIVFYYAGMTLGRFISGVIASKLSSWKIIHIGQAVVLGAIIILLMPVPAEIAGFALFMIGLGNGPLFPNMIHLVPGIFGEEESLEIMGREMAVAYIGIMMMPALFGIIAEKFGLGTFAFYLMILFAVMVTAVIKLVKILKGEKRYAG